MACQPVASNQTFKANARQTKRQIQMVRRRIHRIEHAKALVVGVVAPSPLHELQRSLESVLATLEKAIELLTSGWLDTQDDEQLKEILASLQTSNQGISIVIEGASRIGLEGCDPFPALLEQLRRKQERLQSNIEGILLSLDDSFQGMIQAGTSELKPIV